MHECYPTPHADCCAAAGLELAAFTSSGLAGLPHVAVTSVGRMNQVGSILALQLADCSIDASDYLAHYSAQSY